MKLVLPALLTAVTVCIAGCNFGSKDTAKAVKEVSAEVDQLTKTLTDYVGQAEAPEEVKKLQQWEYQVLNVPAATPPRELEGRMNELGKERWECFHAEKFNTTEGAELMLMCKRRPYTPLKYLPRSIIGSY